MVSDAQWWLVRGSGQFPSHSPTCLAGHLDCPHGACRVVEHRVRSPIRLIQPSPVTGTGSQRSEMSPSLNSNLDRPRPSPPSPSLCLSREEKGQRLGNRGGDEFPSLSQKEKLIQPRAEPAQVGYVPASVSRCLDQSPLVGFSKQESKQTLSEKSRPAISAKDYNRVHSSRPGSVYNLKVSF